MNQSDCSDYLLSLLAALQWPLTESLSLFIQRLASSIRRDSHPLPHVPLPSPFVRSSRSPVPPLSLPLSQRTGLAVMEFFSGIGGMRMALPSHVTLPSHPSAPLPFSHITAFDVSLVANQVYRYNFHSSSPSSSPPLLDDLQGQLKALLIDSLKLHDVEGMADLWTLSPPCQPFTTTRMALQKGGEDARCRPLFHLMSLLAGMKPSLRPRWILLENVKGFAGSSVNRQWRETLEQCGYRFREFLLSPVDLGIPNHRSRFYSTAQLVLEEGLVVGPGWGGTEPDELITSLPPSILQQTLSLHSRLSLCECCSSESLQSSSPHSLPAPDNTDPSTPLTSHSLSRYLLPLSRIPISHYPTLFLSPSLLSNPSLMCYTSIVHLRDSRSYCFTKGYGRLVQRNAGSLVLGEEGPRGRWNGWAEHWGLDSIIPFSEDPSSFPSPCLYSRDQIGGGTGWEAWNKWSRNRGTQSETSTQQPQPVDVTKLSESKGDDDDDDEDDDDQEVDEEGEGEGECVGMKTTQSEQEGVGYEETGGRLRLFHPDELLALSGFPAPSSFHRSSLPDDPLSSLTPACKAFRWPPSLSLRQCWACIGNSVNVAVVRGVMMTLFSESK